MDEFQIYSGNYIRMLFSTLGARFCMAHTMRLIRCWDKRSSVGRVSANGLRWDEYAQSQSQLQVSYFLNALYYIIVTRLEVD